MKPFLPLGLALVIVIAPVAHAQNITQQFKAELAAKVGTKTGNAAAKAAAKTIAKYVVAAPKGDPRKIVNFTKLGIKSIKKANANAGFAKFWSKFATFDYFKKGLKSYDPADKKFAKALNLVYKLKGVKKNDTAVKQAFKQLKTNNKKLSTAATVDANLGILQQEVAAASKVTPAS